MDRKDISVTKSTMYLDLALIDCEAGCDILFKPIPVALQGRSSHGPAFKKSSKRI